MPAISESSSVLLDNKMPAAAASETHPLTLETTALPAQVKIGQGETHPLTLETSALPSHVGQGECRSRTGLIKVLFLFLLLGGALFGSLAVLTPIIIPPPPTPPHGVHAKSSAPSVPMCVWSSIGNASMLFEELPLDASSSVLQRDNYSASDYASLEAALAHVVSNVEVTESDSLMDAMNRFHDQLADPSGKMLNNSNMSAMCVIYETFLPRVGLNGIAQAVGALPYPKTCACTCTLTHSPSLH